MSDTTQTTQAPNYRLRLERERRCWSQQELADRVGSTPLNVSRWERGVTVPSPYFRQKLCEVLEKSAQELGLVPSAVEDKLDILSTTPSNTHSGESSPGDTPASFWNIPYRRNPFFTGREGILVHLHDVLLPEQLAVALTQPQAISGLGGVGKTQTAIEYAYRYRESYQGVFWARAESRDLLISDFLTIASLLKLPLSQNQEQEAIVRAVQRWFDTHDGWLLILDNADNLEVVGEFIPSAGKGHVLLTTRIHSMGTIAQRIEIEKMDIDEGTLFLLRRAKILKESVSIEQIPEGLRTFAQTIVKAVDGLPLALDQAGAYIEETGCSLPDYLKFYKTRRKRLLRTRGQDASGHPEPVATTWSLSFEKVEQANPAAAELLRLCAFLHPDEIPEAMIVGGTSELGPVLQSVAEDELELNEAIGELRKYSLIKRDTEAKLLNMHRLVQAVIKDGMDEEIQREWAERVLRMVNKAFPKVEFSQWSVCQQYLPHVQVCMSLTQQWEILSQEAIRLFHETSRYLHERAQYTDAESLCQQALAMRESLLGSDHPDVAESLNHLAAIRYQQGRYKQMQLFAQHALAIQEEKLPPDHPAIAESLTNLGVAYNSQGEYAQARQHLERALAIREQVLGEQHLDTATSLLTLASFYRDQREYERAEPLFKRALMMYEQILGPDHPHVAMAFNNFAGLYNEQGKYEQAEPLFKRSLAMNERLLGPEHPQVGLNFNNLAMIYFYQGKYEQSEPFLLRTRSIFEQALGPEHPLTALVIKNLAKLYAAQERYEEADAFFSRSLALREQSLGATHPLVIRTLQDYAEFLRKISRETEAAEMEARAQAIRAEQH